MSANELRLERVYDLTGQVALVTGGGSGIGLMIARGLAVNGAKVYISGRRLDILQRAASSLSQDQGTIIPLQMDVTDKTSIQAGRDEIATKEGKLDILVNNAGQVGPVSNFVTKREHKDAGTLGQALFDNETFEGWGKLYDINTFSIFFVTNAFLGLLQKGTDLRPQGSPNTSSVVNITSISGVIKLAQDHFCYNSSKAAAGHLTKMLATEYALSGVKVRVNAVAPGVYESGMTSDKLTGREQTDSIGKGLQSCPAERPGSAQEIAGTVIYLSTPAGGYTNGQEIVIDGGYTAVNPATV